MAQNKFNWSIIGHEKIRDYLTRQLETGNFSHAYLFCGPRKIGRTTVAKQFSNFLLCDNYQKLLGDNKSGELIGCGSCQNCRQFQKGIFADFHLLERDLDDKGRKKQEISVRQMRELNERLNKHTFQNSYKIVLIPEAERLSEEASNSLLKFLEEPTAKTVLILITTNRELILPTIQSRCQIINFSPVASRAIYDHLLALGADRELARELAAVSVGRPTVALKYFESPELYRGFKDQVHGVFQLLKSNRVEQFQFLEKLFGRESDSEKAIEVLNILSSLIRDYQLIRSNNQSFVSNLFLLNDLQGLKINGTEKILVAIEEARTFIKQNVNPKFVLENLLLSINN